MYSVKTFAAWSPLQPFARGFTIVELLVVLTIIVVLLALLAPALDQAVYQAELAACGGRLRAQAMGAVQYTHDSARRYPYRAGVEFDDVRADYLMFFSRFDRPVYNDRPALASYMSINETFNCPQVQAVDLEAPGPDEPYILFTSYGRYCGWRFRNGNTIHKGMRRLGDRFEYVFLGAGGASETVAFSVLATDADFIVEGGTVHSAHSDADGRLASLRLEHYPQTNARGQYFISFSYWYTDSNRGPVTRGPVDRNFAYEDTSVRRIGDIIIDDPRLLRVSSHSSVAVGRDTFLPAN